MARIRKEFFSNCSMMSPIAFLRTASGLTMVRVRWRVFIPFVDPWSFFVETLLAASLAEIGNFAPGESRRSELNLNGGLHAYSDGGGERFADRGRGLRHLDSCCFQGLHFFRGRAFAARDNGAGVAHTAARRGGLAGDKTDDWLFHVRFYEFGGGFFGVAADFADHDHGFRFGVAIEQVEGIHECGADDRVASNADGGGLPDAALRELVDRFVGEGARAGDDPNISLLVDRG